jgi:hypothetical protein
MIAIFITRITRIKANYTNDDGVRSLRVIWNDNIEKKHG